MTLELRHREAVTAAVAVLAATVAGVLTLDLPTALVSAAFAGLVAIAAVHDLVDYRLPDSINAAMLVLGLGFALFEANGDPAGLVAPLARVIVVAVLMMALRSAYLALRGRSGLGLGDVKLAAAGAAWLPAELIAWAMLVAALAALLLVLLLRLRTGRNEPGEPLIVPFGAFLGPAIWLVWFAAAIAGQP